jgi:ribosomal protein S18 acetylase RimI-like enzyme
MSALALARSPVATPARSRSRRPAAAVRAAWPFSVEDADTADASSVPSPSSPPSDEKARRDRLEQLSQSYAQRRSSPPLPEGYAVRVLPDPTKGSSKTRVEVTVADPNLASASSGVAVAAWITCWPRRTRSRDRESDEPVSSLFLSSVEVKKAHRRRGLARALLREVEALAAETGCAETSLTVVKTNAPAIALYASCGYTTDEGAGDDAFSRLADVITDPQRLMQHRMFKRVERKGATMTREGPKESDSERAESGGRG